MEQAPKNFPGKIKRLYEETYTNPTFREEGVGELSPAFTVLDTFAIPEDLVQNQKKFLAWFEPRFIELRRPEDFQLFSETIREALRILEENKFLLSPRVNNSFPVSPSIKRRAEKGFYNLEEVLAFFGKVAVKNDPENFKEFLAPNRKSSVGAEKLSTCRILSIAYVLDKIKNEHNFEKFLEYSRSALGRSEKEQKESGLLSTLITKNEPAVLTGPQNPSDVFSWLERGEILKGCNLNNIGTPRKRSFYIPEVHIGTKSGLRSMLKVLRDSKAEFRPLDDFLRMRFVFEDSRTTEEMLEVLIALEGEAETKTDPKTELDFRAKSYFTKKELDLYFPIILEKGRDGTEIRSGILKRIKIDRNPNAGGKYKNMSVKINLYKPEDDPEKVPPFFSYEIQFLRKTELERNESLEMPSSHFILDMKQAIWAFSRLTGKTTREEMTRSIKEYLIKYVRTKNIPGVLVGEVKNPKEGKSSTIEVDFSGTIEEKAQKLFDFLAATGTIKKVSANFPELERPTEASRFKSTHLLSKKAREATLGLLGTWAKKKSDSKKKQGK